MNRWKDESLGDVAEINPPEKIARGLAAPFIDMASVATDCGGVQRVISKIFKGGGTRFRSGDTLVARITPCLENGKIAAVPPLEAEVGFGSTEFIVLRGDGVTTSSAFLRYLAMTSGFREYAEQNLIGSSGRQRVSANVIAEYRVPLPPLEEQERIAGVLGAFDDLIDTNRRLIGGLDDLFQSLWREDYSRRAAFPKQTLAAIASTQYGLTASASDDPSGVKFLRVTDINKQNWINWDTVPTVPSSEVKGDKYRLRAGDLLVARMADPGKSAIYEGGPDAVFASYLVRLKPNTYEDGLYLYGFLKSADYEHYAAGAMSGSVQKNMNAKVISAATLNWPDEKDRLAFAGKVASIRAAQSSLLAEVADLTKQRDELLPLLMSGRVRVRDLEAVA